MQKPQMVPLTLEGTKIPGAHCHGEKTKGRNESMQVNIMRLLVVLNGHFLVGYENNFVVDILFMKNGFFWFVSFFNILV